MDSIELARIERRTRFAYELGRLRRALIGVAPVLVIVALATALTDRPASAIAFGASTVALGIAMLWHGRDPQRAVLPGVAAGLIPLVFALLASHLHVCGADGCTSLCVPACTVGGVIAGLVVASVGRQRTVDGSVDGKRGVGPWFWVSASALTLLTGAMGCACLGYSGVIGLGLGFGAGMVPGLVRWASTRRRT